MTDLNLFRKELEEEERRGKLGRWRNQSLDGDTRRADDELLNRRRRNHSLDDGDSRHSLDLWRDLFRWNQSPDPESKRRDQLLLHRNQSADHDMRQMDELQYKNPNMDTELERMVEQHENGEPLKREEGPDGEESRRIEKKQFGGDSRGNQSPDGELREVKGRSRMIHGENILRVKEEDYGEQEMARVFGEWKTVEGGLEGPSEV